jgi:DNA-binding MltR family transcriptional regulator
MSEPEIPEGIHQVINRLGELNNVVFVLGEAARLEDMLEKIILAAMPNLTKSMKGMHFKGTGSFASFRGRTDMAYAMGLIKEWVFHDLNVIREVRNKFAHPKGDVTFNTNAVCSVIERFRTFHPHADHYMFFIQRLRLCGESLRRALP